MKYLIYSLTFLFLSQSFAQVEDRVGRFYELGSPTDGKPLFIQKIHRETKPDGSRISDSTIEDANGKLAMTEKAVLAGSRIVSQRIDQLQIGESYELETKDGNAVFRTYKLKGEKRELASEHSVKLTPDFITGPATEPFLKEKLAGKKEVKSLLVEFGIFELEKAISFEFQNRGTLEGGKITKVRMKPDSFWLSAIVSPIDMELDSQSFTLLNYKGRTPVRTLVHGSLKALDAQIIYTDK